MELSSRDCNKGNALSIFPMSRKEAVTCTWEIRTMSMWLMMASSPIRSRMPNSHVLSKLWTATSRTTNGPLPAPSSTRKHLSSRNHFQPLNQARSWDHFLSKTLLQISWQDMGRLPKLQFPRFKELETWMHLLIMERAKWWVTRK